jgi:hypothetical protein
MNFCETGSKIEDGFKAGAATNEETSPSPAVDPSGRRSLTFSRCVPAASLKPSRTALKFSAKQASFSAGASCSSFSFIVLTEIPDLEIFRVLSTKTVSKIGESHWRVTREP